MAAPLAPRWEQFSSSVWLREGVRDALASRILAQAGDWVLLTALFVLVNQRGGLTAVALLLLARLVPRLLALPFHRQLVGNTLPQELLAAAEITRAIVIGSLAIVLWEEASLWLWGAVVFSAGLGVLTDARRDAALVSFAPPTGVGAANAAAGWLDRVACIIGPIVGGTLAATGAAPAAFLVASGLLFGSAWLLQRMHRQQLGQDNGPVAGAGWSDTSGDWDGLWRLPGLRMLAGCLFVGAAVMMAGQAALPALVTGPLDLPAVALGPLMAIVGVGMLAGPLPVVRLLGRLSGVVLVAMAVLAQAVGLALLAVAPWQVVAMALLVGGALAVARDLAAMTAIRRLVPAPHFERAVWLLRTVVILGQVAGVLAVGALAAFQPLAGVLLAASAAGSGLLVLLALASGGKGERRRAGWTNGRVWR